MKKILLTLIFVFTFSNLIFARGWTMQDDDWVYVDDNNELLPETIQTGALGMKFYLDENGIAVKDFFLEDYNGDSYYFGPYGGMEKNVWVAVDSSMVENKGDYTPEFYYYYFGANGKAVRGTSDNPKKMVIDGKKYLFNEYGQMCSGWIDANGKSIDPNSDNPFAEALYYAGDDDDGVLRSGWVAYYDGYSDGEEWLDDKEVLYFYFDTQNNKKVGFDGATTKNINNKTYAFTNEGVMMSKWDYANSNIEVKGLSDKYVYFSDDEDGFQVKKGWVYTIPSQTLDAKGHDDGEEKWFYFGNSGHGSRDTIEKINSKYYAFDEKGIMQTGLIVWCNSGVQYNMKLDGETEDKVAVGNKFICKIDLESATGEEFTKKGILRYGDGDNDYIKVTTKGLVAFVDGRYYNEESGYDPSNPEADERKDTIVIQYFDTSGERKTGLNDIEFSDGVYSFESNTRGNINSGLHKKKYYSLGVLLKANPDIKYGIVLDENDKSFFANKETGYNTTGNSYCLGIYQPQGASSNGSGEGSFYQRHLIKNMYKVVDSSGKIVEGNDTAKKDGNGNYWYISKKHNNALIGIYTKPVKRTKNKVVVKGEYIAHISKLDAQDPGIMQLPNSENILEEPVTDGATSIKFKKDFSALDIATGLPNEGNGFKLPFVFKPYSDNADGIFESVSWQSFDREISEGQIDEVAAYLKFNVESYKNANPDKDTFDPGDDIICKLSTTWDTSLYYKSEYDGKEQWLPFGFFDDTKHCASDAYRYGQMPAPSSTKPYDPTRHYMAGDCYQVEPDNDYFLNCYWHD